MDQMDKLVNSFARSDDPIASIDAAYEEAMNGFVAKLEGFNPFELIEVARVASLPLAFMGQIPAGPDASAARIELLGAMALAASSSNDLERDESLDGETAPQTLSRFISEEAPEVDNLIRLAHLRAIARTDPSDKMTMIALLVRGNEVWMRNTSYSEMVEVTVRQLFETHVAIRNALDAGLGFGAADALAVLTAVDSHQQEAMNDRFQSMIETIGQAMGSTIDGQLDPETRDRARASFSAALEPTEDAVTVSVAELSASTQIAVAKVQAIVDRFSLDLSGSAPADVVEAFTAGANPWRNQPLAATKSGRVMMPHHALTVDAVRHELEAYLKGTKSWNAYAKHRGELLESRVSAALGKVLQEAEFRNGFEYYLPNDQAELDRGDPQKYTKRVEGDHLIILDDVALVVEDKAVALSVQSRHGKLTRMRTDLTGILTRAAEQSGRLREAIGRDGGLRIENEGWVDLRHIREVHTIAVSLDDLSSVTTATTELVRAGLLDSDNIPWTVSLHDLELIIDLVGRPAEFLLYLRRRRNPQVTSMFTAVDELDLFLYFLEAGLWVEPDPDRVRAAFPYMPEPTTAERRRYRAQRPGLVTSRTDQLDQWFHAQHARTVAGADEPGHEATAPPKPQMVPSPLAAVLDELETRKSPGWLSIGATLLGEATTTQHKTVSDLRSMLDNPAGGSMGRSLTQPLTGTTNPEEGWLLVWATLPTGVHRPTEEKRLRDYLRVKKHQLALPRGALFLYSEATRELDDVFFDDHIGPLTPELAHMLHSLKPMTAFESRPHPDGRKVSTPNARLWPRR